MNFSSINWLAVLVCVIVSMVSGSLWYNPKTFFPIWWEGIGKGKNDKPGTANMGMVWGLTILASLVQAIFVGVVVHSLGSHSPTSGALTGFLLWLGFVAPTNLVNKLFAGHGLKVWAIEAGNHLINFVLFGAIFGLWR
jgi:hypothetical protein